jgi:hypothetical protein
MLRVEVPMKRVGEWSDGILRCGVYLDSESHRSVGQHENPELSVDGEVTVTLHVRFVHNEPDLRIHTPAVPG